MSKEDHFKDTIVLVENQLTGGYLKQNKQKIKKESLLYSFVAKVVSVTER
jgi:hypothetical protein